MNTRNVSELRLSSRFNQKSPPLASRRRAISDLLIAALTCALLAPVSVARTHSNSMMARPDNLHLADVNGDGFAEWAGYANDAPSGGYVISIARAMWSAMPLLTIDRRYRTTGHSETVTQMFTGHFLDQKRLPWATPGRDQESVCIYTNTGHVQCFVINLDTASPYWYSDQATGSFMNQDILVGDFDGDGLDELLLYNRWTAAVELWKYNTSIGQFAPVSNFAPGNFGDDASIIAGSPIVLVGDFADFSDGRRDDLLVCNSSGQVSRYDARQDSSGRTTFWIAFRTRGSVAACSPYNVSVADVTGWGLESLVLRNSSNGSVRFLDMRWMPSTGLLAGYLVPVDTYWTIGSVNEGQIGPGDGFLMWAKMSRWPGESGANTRDDVFLYTSDASLSEYDARYYAPTFAYTYWWGFTQPLSYLLTRMFSWAAPS